jgi:hypothetical protein
VDAPDLGARRCGVTHLSPTQDPSVRTTVRKSTWHTTVHQESSIGRVFFSLRAYPRTPYEPTGVSRASPQVEISDEFGSGKSGT